MVALSLVVILGAVAFSVDGGRMLAQRRNVQAATDAAALAAAADLYNNYWTNNGLDPSHTARDAAIAAATANGFTNGGNTTVTINIPPSTGAYAGKSGYAEVLIQYTDTRTFGSVLGSDPVPVGGRAVAIGQPIAANVGILVLDPSAKSAFNSNGGGASVVNGTPVVVNSTHAQGSIAGGGGSLTADEFDLAGGYTTTGGGSFVGPIHTGRQAMGDPLTDIPVPDPASMTVRSNNKTQYTSGSTTLSPGVYTGGISVSGSGTLTLLPGIYYMDGGGFSFSGQGSLEGRGVMIYNNPGNGNSDGISVSGQGSMILSAPTSGVYQGMTFFQNRTSTVTGSVSGTGGNTSITGTFYFAGAQLNVSGNGGVANMGSQYISNKLTLGGNGGIKIDWQPDQVARRRQINLVE